MTLLDTRYFTGKPCVRGHVAERLKSTRRCVQCQREDERLPHNIVRNNARIRRSWANKPDFRNRRAKRAFLWRERNKDKLKVSSASKYQATKDQVMLRVKNRKFRSKGAEGKYVLADLYTILERQGFSCFSADCGVSFFVVDPTIDHIVPLSRGGSNWPDNIQLLCQSCNDSKGPKTMEEWKPNV